MPFVLLTTLKVPPNLVSVLRKPRVDLGKIYSLFFAKRWIILGPFYFQPSEVGKFIYVICIARFFTDFRLKKQLSLQVKDRVKPIDK